MSERWICVACGTQYAETEAPPAECPVCVDPRQYVPVSGQRWTTRADLLAAGHTSPLRQEGELTGVFNTPKIGIGQRALLVPYGESNLLWDCVTLVDDAAAEAIDARGGLAAIAISHPHYYTTMVDWAHRFDCPVHLHAADAEWVARPDPAIRFWDGETLDLGHGLTLVRGGGHFSGAQMLHWPHGDGALLSGDVIQVVPDRSHVAFMWSYPNYVPLPLAAVEQLAACVEPFAFEAVYGAFPGFLIPTGAKAVVRRSAERYARALRGELPA